MVQEKILNYIGGSWLPAESESWFDNVSPHNGEIFQQVPRSGPGDIEKAVDAAEKALSYWSATTIQDRANLLFRISDAIVEKQEDLASAESLDQGKPFKLALEMDIKRAALNFRYFGGAVLHKSEQAYSYSDQVQNITRREPVGVCGLISPWNLPLYLLTWKIAPALACGNTLVCKPSEVTPYTAYLLSKILSDVGLPEGVCNIVFGYGQEAGAALAGHPRVPLISFTGGTQTSEKISAAAAPFAKKLSLELGGKNPALIFSDCDLDKAVQTSVRSSFLNQGEICLCTSRILVEDGIYEQFIEKFVAQVEKLKTGDPSQPENFLGAIASAEHLKKIESYANLARDEGCDILTGGERLEIDGPLEKGYFFPPTVVTGVTPESKIFQDEIFGPLVCILPFSSVDQAVELANATKYGLAATVFSSNAHTIQKVTSRIRSGIVWVNTWLNRDLRTPFGGMKASGLGREGGAHSLDFYSELKNICIEYEA